MQNTNKIRNWISALIPPALIAFSVLTANLSGNDKAPILILMAIGVNVIVFIFSGLYFLFNRSNSGISRFLFTGSTITLIYIVVAVFLSFAGIVDSIYLLGFR